MLKMISKKQKVSLISLVMCFICQRSKLITRSMRVVSVLFFFLAATTANAVVTPNFGFANGPTLLPGGNAHLTVGAKYIYQNVETSSDGVLVDAVVTIVAINNSAIKNNTIDQVLGEDVRFEPSTNTSSGGGYVEWQIEFVQDGTVVNASDVGVRAYLDSFVLEAIDVDGHEFFEAIVTNSYTVKDTGTKAANLTVSTNGAYTKFQSAAEISSGIDITKTEFIVRVNYQNVNVINFRNGSSVNSDDRDNSMSFQGEVTFITPKTTVFNVPPTVVNNTGNVSNIDTAFNVNLLAGASDSDGNIVLSTVALIDPDDASNLGAVGSPLVIPGVGTYTVTASGALSFMPNSGYTGSANVLFTVSDNLNVSSDRGMLGLVIDDLVDPVVTLNAMPVAYDANETVYPVSGTCTAGDGDVSIIITGAVPNPASAVCTASGTFSTTVDVSGINDGTAVIVANASQTDSAGNIGNATQVTANKDTEVDNTACVFSPSTATTGTPISVTCTGVESGSSISIGALLCGVESSGSITCTGNAESAGTNPPIIITDSVGNTNTITGVFTFDGVAPVVAITSAPTATSANENNYPVSGTCTAGDGDVTVSIAGVTPSQTIACNAGNWGPVIFDVSSLPDGIDVIDINASQTDSAGNVGNAPLFEADKTPAVDTDNDGIEDSLDLDSDNDGIPDTIEIAGAINSGDTDNDGVADFRDLDADGDGISDIAESGLSSAQILSLDTNGDGSIDEPVGANGLADAIEDVDTASAVITYNGGSPIDTDGDSHYDFQDLDADNDGIHDLAESGLNIVVLDVNNDGVLDANATDADQDGLPDSLDANDAGFGGVNSNPVDTDGDSGR